MLGNNTTHENAVVIVRDLDKTIIWTGVDTTIKVLRIGHGHVLVLQDMAMSGRYNVTIPEHKTCQMTTQLPDSVQASYLDITGRYDEGVVVLDSVNEIRY